MPRTLAGVRDAVDRALEATVVLSFTRVGHDARSRLQDWDDDLDGTGKVVVVTGATSGIGKEAAVQLARAGATVHFLARSPQKAADVREQIVRDSGSDLVTYGIADLADLTSVRAFATETLKAHDRIDVLVHNAGALLADRVETVDGMEFTFQSQVVAPTLLTHLLQPALAAADGQVIFVASGGLYSEKLAPARVEMGASDYNGTVAYARAKRAQLALTHLWSKSLATDGIQVNTMHPGWVDTPGVEASLPTFRRIVGPLLRPVDQGADTITWLALHPAAAGETGKFWLDRAPRPEHKLSRTRLEPQEQQRREAALWELIRTRADLPVDALGVTTP